MIELTITLDDCDYNKPLCSFVEDLWKFCGLLDGVMMSGDMFAVKIGDGERVSVMDYNGRVYINVFCMIPDENTIAMYAQNWFKAKNVGKQTHVRP